MVALCSALRRKILPPASRQMLLACRSLTCAVWYVSLFAANIEGNYQMNVVTLIGNIATDPTTGNTRGGDAHARFRLAVNAGKDRADFFTIKCFGRAAEIVAEYAAKGQQIAVNGRLATNEWEHEGRQMRDVEIVAIRVQLIGKRDDAPGQSPAEVSAAASFDDIPF